MGLLGNLVGNLVSELVGAGGGAAGAHNAHLAELAIKNLSEKDKKIIADKLVEMGIKAATQHLTSGQFCETFNRASRACQLNAIALALAQMNIHVLPKNSWMGIKNPFGLKISDDDLFASKYIFKKKYDLEVSVKKERINIYTWLNYHETYNKDGFAKQEDVIYLNEELCKEALLLIRDKETIKVNSAIFSAILLLAKNQGVTVPEKLFNGNFLNTFEGTIEISANEALGLARFLVDKAINEDPVFEEIFELIPFLEKGSFLIFS
jgi:hypothetical protein